VFWWGNLGASAYLEDPGIDGRKLLKWFFKKGMRGHELD